MYRAGRYLMRRMRISTLLADPSHSSFRQHHVTTTCRRYARRRHSGYQQNTCPGLCRLESPQPTLCSILQAHTPVFSLFCLPKRALRTGGETEAARPPGKNSAIVGPRAAHSIHKPDFPPRFEKLGLALAKGRLRNEANNRLDGLEWGGGSTK
ncbi:hypothetical protein J3E68DRAFT_125883 [Trichoderma sp. SZMC 28012]